MKQEFKIKIKHQKRREMIRLKEITAELRKKRKSKIKSSHRKGHIEATKKSKAC